jgi:hypothetical protein
MFTEVLPCKWSCSVKINIKKIQISRAHLKTLILLTDFILRLLLSVDRTDETWEPSDLTIRISLLNKYTLGVYASAFTVITSKTKIVAYRAIFEL